VRCGTTRNRVAGPKIANDQDVLKFTNLTPADVTLGRDANDGLVVQINATGQHITVLQQFDPDTTDPANGIEQIAFANGTTWDRAAIADAAGPAPQPIIIGTEGADVLHADNGENLILGLGGDDTIFGAGGDDTIDGGTGNDALHGDAGDDWFVAAPGDGNDVIDGGDGYDSVDYSAIETPILVDLGQATVTGADSGTDTLVNIEAVYGGSGEDTLIGSSVYDELYGGDGNDTLVAVGGLDFGDYLEGDAGNDLRGCARAKHRRA